ncbi:hypothetical protein BOSE62_140065 [Bosea sp. 62]|nr:hypothetical protein BOSE7B_150066 [Bosea sp. 7B]CAD5271447.1 hypothetical protein BOSE21B_20001 [Bosea sp. 21B]CAD5273573.1 hypothetical protein BOSE46_20300 [Bosea sp. 46]VVT56159.1 hypothetical protein BOS5A_140001 [Bosea sp. EC-HK365B]VXB63981.1 hypothetical protein BOSE62_140065 [Bosea sp. 62]VXC06016.1 hypothetical protein BOSE29B_20002 [Bosea sp. 29B]VXC29731.1 hypothetical protein BOSE127_180068 [Bosea sp. 127]VXC60741.1 hypothetical protein BOSE125_30317 [Bosea sp. 125]
MRVLATAQTACIHTRRNRAISPVACGVIGMVTFSFFACAEGAVHAGKIMHVIFDDHPLQKPPKSHA